MRLDVETGSPRPPSTRLDRLRHGCVALPALVLEHDLLDRDIRAVGVERRERLVERRPAAIDLVGEHELPRLVIELEEHVLAEVGERNLASQRRAEAPSLVRPVFEGAILG